MAITFTLKGGLVGVLVGVEVQVGVVVGVLVEVGVAVTVGVLVGVLVGVEVDVGVVVVVHSNVPSSQVAGTSLPQSSNNLVVSEPSSTKSKSVVHPSSDTQWMVRVPIR